MNTSIGNTPNGKPGATRGETQESNEKDFSEASQVDASQGADQGVRGDKSSVTESSDGQERRPRMPHERDESSDAHKDGVRPVGEKAHDDVTSGRVDTDRGAPMDETYRKQKHQGPTSTQK